MLNPSQKILVGASLLLVFCACSNQTPRDKAKLAVESFLSDSLKVKSVRITEISKFDTITVFDSLNNQLRFIDDNLRLGNEKMDEVLHHKEMYEGLKTLSAVFEGSKNDAVIKEADQNLEITINNLNIGIERYEGSKKKVLEQLKNESLKNKISGYSLLCQYKVGDNDYTGSFYLSKTFTVDR